jgi:cysteine synthase A
MTARKSVEAVAQMEGPNPYGIKVSTAQGVVKGLVGGELSLQPLVRYERNSN